MALEFGSESKPFGNLRYGSVYDDYPVRYIFTYGMVTYLPVVPNVFIYCNFVKKKNIVSYCRFRMSVPVIS